LKVRKGHARQARLILVQANLREAGPRKQGGDVGSLAGAVLEAQQPTRV
jgi:hypothetical protein